MLVELLVVEHRHEAVHGVVLLELLFPVARHRFSPCSSGSTRLMSSMKTTEPGWTEQVCLVHLYNVS